MGFGKQKATGLPWPSRKSRNLHIRVAGFVASVTHNLMLYKRLENKSNAEYHRALSLSATLPKAAL